MMIIVGMLRPMSLATMMVVRVNVTIMTIRLGSAMMMTARLRVMMTRRIGAAQIRDCRVRFVRTSAGGTHREYLYFLDSQS
jgi:hypothetical protein